MKHCTTCQHLFPDALQACPSDNVPLRLARELEPGMIIRGKYVVQEWIGAGGMATVYRARHRLLNEMRAVKVVSLKFSHDEDFLKRFRHEAAVARRLRHENAVWVEDLDEIEDGRPFIAMEFLQGHDLRKLIKDQGPLSVQLSLNLGAQVASALSAAHKLGIVHRDIKPDNIFVTRDSSGKNETAKVLDFGIAKAKEGALQGGYTATKTGVLIGTPEYMSPEQAEGQLGDKLDGRSDIYSLGVVLYEMLTGQLPFHSDTPLGMCLHHLQTIPRPPHELRPELRIPENVSAMLMKALEKRRERRFQTADDIAAALRHPAEWGQHVVTDNAIAPTKVSRSTTRSSNGESLLAPVQPTVAAVAKHSKQQENRTGPQPPSAASAADNQLENRRETEGISGVAIQQPGNSRHVISNAPPADKARSLRIVVVAVVVIVCVAAGYLLVNAIQRRNTELRARESLIREQILDRFRTSPALQGMSNDITVSVNADAVTLAGSVPFPENKNEAGNEARTIPGIANVTNNIVVVPGGVSLPETQLDRDQPRQNTGSQRAPTDSATDKPAQRSPTPSSHQRNFARTTDSANIAKSYDSLRQGNAALDQGNYAAAINDFEQAVQLDPRNAAARKGLKRAQNAQKAEQEVLGKQ